MFFSVLFCCSGDARATVVTGKIEQGIVKAGDALEFVGLHQESKSDVVKLNVALMSPVALTCGDKFANRGGSKTIGSGVVTKVTA